MLWVPGSFSSSQADFRTVLGLVGEELKDLSGLYFRAPTAAVAMLIFMLSLGGIPPTAGFMAKFWLFSAAIDANYVWLAVLGVVNSAISLYYSSLNNINGNSLTSNGHAIRMDSSNYNSITSNNITSNTYGIYYINCQGNRIFHNNLNNSAINAYGTWDLGPPVPGNTWDGGYPSGGNLARQRECPS
jgi:parallel beta-helix repeat protein